MHLFASSSSDSSRSCTSPVRLLLSLLALSSFSIASPNPVQLPLKSPANNAPSWSPTQDSPELSFTLRHIFHHGADRYPHLFRRKDVRPSDSVWVATEGEPPTPPPRLSARGRSRPIQRLSDRRKDVIEEYLLMNRHGVAQSYTADAWALEDILQPDITDRDTVISLAKMTANAYVEIPGTEDWLEAGGKWNVSDDFGWEGDGLRGHIFVDDANTTVIIGLKGTSVAIFDGPETTTNDKINDNLLFSCCCARVGHWWKTVCNCYSGSAYRCGKTCLKNALLDENRYYRASLNLYYNVTQMYPNATNTWVVGHSLGGSVSSLLGLTYGLPVVTFEAPGEAMAAARIGIPSPPGGKFASHTSGVYHFGNSADPLFIGTCNGVGSACSLGGYAMESKCHTGQECMYDVVGDLGWRVGIGYHRIQLVIKDILEKYETVPVCEADPDCIDCYSWIYDDRNDTTTKTTKTTTTKTTTTSCKTKGFWGCLDETTTTTTATDPITTTTDPVTTTTDTTTTHTTSTCTKYNWYWRCIDKGTTWTSTDTTPTTTPTTTPATTPTPPTTTTCTSKGWLGGCLDPTTTINTTTKETTTTTNTATDEPDCTHKGWFGGCLDPTWDDSPGAEPSPTTPKDPEPTDDPWDSKVDLRG